MPSTVRFLGALALAAGLAAPAAAQVVPGYQSGDAQPALVRYRSAMFREVNTLLSEWRSAWDDRNAAAAAGMFTANGALLLPDRRRAEGRRAVRAELEQVLPSAGAIAFTLNDFAVSESIAYVLGRYSLRPPGASEPAEGGAEPGVTGSYVATFQMEGDAWKIRMLILRPESLPAF